MKFYQYPDQYNVGDCLTQPVLEHFLPGIQLERVDENHTGKIVAIGSVMSKVRQNDIVWGTGIIKNQPPMIPLGVEVLAVRGKMTRELMRNVKVPEIFGDPALLLPRIYNPDVKKTHAVGIVPHYVDKKIVLEKYAFASGANKFIDVALPWQEFVREILSCERIVSSSLHGLVIAEAYGIPAEWVEYSERVIGKGFKFRDYLTGTGRSPQDPGPLPPIKNISTIQDRLIEALQNKFIT